MQKVSATTVTTNFADKNLRQNALILIDLLTAETDAWLVINSGKKKDKRKMINFDKIAF